MINKFNAAITGAVLIFAILIAVALNIASTNKNKEDEKNTASLATKVYAQSIPYEAIDITANTATIADNNDSAIQSLSIPETSEEVKIQAKEEISEAINKVTPKKKITTISKSSESSAKVVDTTSEGKVEMKEIKEEAEKPVENLAVNKSETTKSVTNKYSAEEIEILYRIVQAEAGGEDAIGKVLVVNVIINRVNSPLFSQNTIKDVVFAAGQFEPVSTGRYYEVEVTSETKEAVQRALSGEDYSKGALYFHATYIDPNWSNLKKLFTYGGHVFYKPRG